METWVEHDEIYSFLFYHIWAEFKDAKFVKYVRNYSRYGIDQIDYRKRYVSLIF